ncbi:MAG: NTP transferase domain-containing protein [Lactobacillaceae bacterium]|jgi:molybdenum cofactor cytidylyltransferase|nr:NTP transferase domain-containing protein [Lactobacillaceae bacterium]
MIYEEVKINKAEGGVLLNDIRTDLGVLYKGHAVTEEDIVMLQVMGIEKVTVVRVEDGDMELKTAQDVISNKICGKNTAYTADENGIVKIIAASDGCFVSDEGRIQKFNGMNKAIIINTIPLYEFVKTGDVIAKLEFELPLYSSVEIEDIIFKLSGNVELVSVVKNEKKKAGVVYTQFYKDKTEKKHFSETLVKLKTKLQNLDVDFAREFPAEHNLHSTADEIENARDFACDIVFVISSLRTRGDNDIVSKAISSIVDEKFIDEAPNVGISDFIVAGKRHLRIINVPYNYKDVDSDVIDEMILKTVILDKISSADFEFKNPVLSSVKEKLTVAEQKKAIVSMQKDSKKATVAIVIFAGGFSTRCGQNKLLANVGGEPLFLRSVKEAIKSNIGPVYVVTGYQAEKIEEKLGDIDVNIINNLSFRDGIKSSINLAVNHVPSFCDGVILLPADMPNITAKHLNRLVKKFDKRKNKQVVVSSWDGVKNNPVLWSKNVMAFAELVPENSYMRPSLVEHEDYATIVDFESEDEALNVDFPADLEKLIIDSGE